MILPNQLTVLRIFLTPVFIYFFLSDDITFKQISLLIFIIAALTDWYDGWLARKYNYFTSWGKFWDPLADKILTASAFIGFVYLGVLQLWMVSIIIFRDLIVTVFRGLADYKKKSFVTSRYAKWKTFIQMVFLYYLLVAYIFSFNPYLYENYKSIFNFLLNENLIYFCMLSITFITIHSGITYIYQNFDLIKKLIKNET